MFVLLVCSAAISAAAASGISKGRFLQKKDMSMKGSAAEVVYKMHHGNHTKQEETIGLKRRSTKSTRVQRQRLTGQRRRIIMTSIILQMKLKLIRSKNLA
jgi:hypothetical protein